MKSQGLIQVGVNRTINTCMPLPFQVGTDKRVRQQSAMKRTIKECRGVKRKWGCAASDRTVKGDLWDRCLEQNESKHVLVCQCLCSLEISDVFYLDFLLTWFRRA